MGLSTFFTLAGLMGAVAACVALAIAWQPPPSQPPQATPDPGPPDILSELRRRSRLTGFVLASALAVSLAMGWQSAWQPRALFQVAFAQVLIALAVIDWRTGWLPDSITQPALWLGLLVQLFAPRSSVGLENAVMGAMIGYMLPLSVSWLFSLFKGQAAIGGGDLKLSALMGAWLGSQAIWFIWFVAPLGLLLAVLPVSGISALQRKMVFGPWLAAGGLAWMLQLPSVLYAAASRL
jgi:leader peptidase (prepilin peptidase) / N-methyltransferase